MRSYAKLNRAVNLVLTISLLLTIYPPQLWASPSHTQARANHSRVAASATEPTVIDQPISLTRSQSSYQAGGQVIVTYTVRSNLGPVMQPDIAPTADLTATAAAVAAVDYANDPNRVRDVLVTLAITGTGSSVVATSIPVDQDGNTLAVNLGDVTPFGETSFAVTLDVPATAADFVALDAGAVAHGNWRGRAVSAETTPITLAPDGFAQFLTCTIDANCNDEHVIAQADSLGSNPTAIFDFVQSLDYHAYDGSLRGARGTLWSEAGNGYDQASLLIALLRASGIPAAYHRATISQGDAQSLLTSMFPADQPLGGYIPAGTVGADPVNDSDLIAEARDHAWVEAYLPNSGWTMLDPANPTAILGDTFTASTSGRLVELPDSVRHKVEIALKVERYSQFPVNGTGLTQISPLSTIINSVELVGEPVVFAHLVDDRTLSGLVFATTDVTYTPYFIVGSDERLIEGDPFQDLITNFPLATNFAVAEWLTFTTIDPAGNRDTYERELFDDIGYAARTGQAYVGLLDRGSGARVDQTSSWSTLFAPSGVPLDALNRRYEEATDLAVRAEAAKQTINDINANGGATIQDQPAIEEAIIALGGLVRLGQRMHLLNFAALLDANNAFVEESTYVEIYPDSPRIFTLGFDRNAATGAETVGFDIGRNSPRVIPHPGQTLEGVRVANTARTVTDMTLENNLLADLAPAPVTSVANIFAKAEADGVSFDRITPGNLHDLVDSAISAEAKARITVALTENPALFVLVPAQMNHA